MHPYPQPHLVAHGLAVDEIPHEAGDGLAIAPISRGAHEAQVVLVRALHGMALKCTIGGRGDGRTEPGVDPRGGARALGHGRRALGSATAA